MRMTRAETLKRAELIAKTIPGARVRKHAWNITVISKSGRHLVSWTGNKEGFIKSGATFQLPNPSVPGGSRPAQVTDRALRLRSAKNPPAGPRVCHYCGDAGTVEVEHIDGFEEHTEPENLAWACRSCNTRKGLFFAREGMGRRTRQYNPAGNPAGTVAAYLSAVASLLGVHREMSTPAAIATVKATPAPKRAKFAAHIRRNPEDVPSFERYKWAVSHHTKGEHDEGGAIIHATPRRLRSEYARQIGGDTAAQKRATWAAKRRADRDQDARDRWD